MRNENARVDQRGRRLDQRLVRLALGAKTGLADVVRGLWMSFLIRAAGGHCGRGLRVGPGVRFRPTPTPGIHIGDDVYLGPHTELRVSSGASLEIGDRAYLTGSTYISSACRVEIGPDVLIAESVSIRDADHGMRAGLLISAQPMHSSPIRIGRGAWVARGVAVLRGADIGEGAVVGANSVARGAVPPGAIAVGAPLRIIGYREPAVDDQGQ